MSRYLKSSQRAVSSIILALFLVLSSVIIYAASTPHVAIESELGTRVGNVTEINDTTAAAGKAIIFQDLGQPNAKLGLELCSRPEQLPYKGDILPYLNSTTDVTVPAGRYSIGSLSQAGKVQKVNVARSNWVKVRAETPGSVVVDGTQNQSGLVIGGGTTVVSQKLIIAGIHFTGTSTLFSSTQDVSLWYTCHEYTPKQWHQNAMATAKRLGVSIPSKGPKDPHGDGGGLYALDPDGTDWQTIAAGMGSYLPTGLRSEAPKGASRDLRFFGVDVGPVADDGIYTAGTWDMVVQGARIHSATELYWQSDTNGISVDPGPVYGDQADQFHNDGIQLNASGWRPTIVDSWSEGRVMFNGAVHTSKTGWDLRVRRAWFGPTLLSGSDGANQVKKLTDNPAFADWMKGDSAGPYPSQPGIHAVATSKNPASTMSGEITDMTYIAHKGSAINFLNNGKSDKAAFTNLKTDTPTVKTFGYGTKSLFLSSATSAIAKDSKNPANIWRATNPYSTMDSFTGLTAAGFRPE